MKNKLQGLSDTELACLAKGGNAAAFEEIYDRHASGVARTLASFAGPSQDVLDDLTQDVFFRVVERLASYVPSHPFAHWLYTIALNVGRNHARRQSKVILIDAHELENFSSDKDQSKDWSDEILETALIRMVSHLPRHMQEVISLRIGSGMSYGEIAELLGIPEGTARSRMHNAVKTLKSKMGLQLPENQIRKERGNE